MQKVSNPVPRIQHPDWLRKRTAAADDKSRQFRITDIFKPAVPGAAVASASRQSDDDSDETDDENEQPVQQEGNSDIDMEDFGAKKIDLGAPKRKKIVKAKPTAVIVVDENDELIANQPDMREDYSGWLNAQKIIWKRQKIARNKARAAGTRRVRTFNSGVENYFIKENEIILTTEWEILQIAETDISGEFIIWAMVGQSMHSFRLIVPRVLYINLKKEDESIADENLPGMHVEKCSSTLPRSHPSIYLYRMTMLERTYQQHLALLGSKFNSQDVEGVYETQVPLLFRALINLGVRVEVKKNSGVRLEDGFALNDLQHIPPTPKSMPYLADRNIAYLVFFHARSGTRHVYAIFSSATNRATIVFVDPGKNLDQIPRNLSRIYSERYDRYVEQTDEDEPTSFAYSDV
jgi:DNA polymerase epsilon subunit 1